jgi:hypothetical protein
LTPVLRFRGNGPMDRFNNRGLFFIGHPKAEAYMIKNSTTG